MPLARHKVFFLSKDKRYYTKFRILLEKIFLMHLFTHYWLPFPSQFLAPHTSKSTAKFCSHRRALSLRPFFALLTYLSIVEESFIFLSSFSDFLFIHSDPASIFPYSHFSPPKTTVFFLYYHLLLKLSHFHLKGKFLSFCLCLVSLLRTKFIWKIQETQEDKNQHQQPFFYWYSGLPCHTFNSYVS